MTTTHRRRPGLLALVVLLLGALLATAAPGPSPAGAGAPLQRPVIFVHGFSGSGNQFESQAMRLASNGYDVDEIAVLEYDSTFFLETRAQVHTRLDALIADLQAESGASQVDLLGHSLGTGLMQEYLNSDADRAADVAHYVNLDGSPAASSPGGVPTLAVWGAGSPTRQIVGATNVYFPEQTHTEVVTSPETFAEVYEFFNNADPETVDIVRQGPGEITLAGRALYFISNAGVTDGQLDIFEVHADSGVRVDATPEATFTLTGDGSWGPFSPDPVKHYEFALTRPGSADSATQHLYFQPFVRTNHLMRLLTSEPNGIVDGLWEKSDDHSNLVLLRNKEWWGDHPTPALNDVLEVEGVNVLNAATAPRTKRALAAFVYDLGSDGVTDVTAPTPNFAAFPFITGMDVSLPATTPPNDTISVTLTPRLGSEPVTLNLPNWVSNDHRSTLQFNDYHVTRPMVADAPTGVSADAGPLLAYLSWSPPDDDGGAPITGYRIVDGSDATVATVAAGVLDVAILGLAEGSTPTFRVIALNDQGESTPSDATAPVTIEGAEADFSDLAEDDPFFAEINWAVDQGLADGYDDGTFGSALPVTRQAAAAFLHRLAGSPAGPFPDPGFSDVPVGHPFYDEIAWLADEGITEGQPDGTFGSTQPLSRQAMAAFLYRLAGEPAGPFPDPGFSDVPVGHPFYDEIAWLADVGITDGYDDGTFRPLATVSRQALMAFLYRHTLVVTIVF